MKVSLQKLKLKGVRISGESIPGRRNTRYKVLDTEKSMVCSRWPV